MDPIDDSLQLHLPTEVICKIFGYLSFDCISKIRLVCQQFNSIASSCLNSGFISAQAKLSDSLKQIKDELPRRESERRKHKLYPRHDALQGLDTRFSLLKMTYNKYILSGACCFIPGKVLDEIFLVLDKIKSCASLQSTSSLLQEVRDISSMAMEHFDDKIAPSFKSCLAHDFDLNFTCTSLSDGSRIPLTPAEAWPSLPSHIDYSNSSTPKCCKLQAAKLKRTQRRNRLSTQFLHKQVVQQMKEIRLMRSNASKRHRLVLRLKGKVTSQARQLHEVQSKLMELTTQVQTLQASLSSDADLSRISQPPHALNVSSSFSKNKNQCGDAPEQLQARNQSVEGAVHCLKRKHDDESVWEDVCSTSKELEIVSKIARPGR